MADCVEHGPLCTDPACYVLPGDPDPEVTAEQAERDRVYWADYHRELALAVPREMARREARRQADAMEAGGGGTLPVDWLELAPYLDGTYEAPTPSVGAVRDDGLALLYPGREHSVIGPTGVGKDWFALACAREEMLASEPRAVLFFHFEEAGPGGTLDRLRAMGVPADVIEKWFRWAVTAGTWTPERMARAVASAPGAVGLVVLNGINAACHRNGQDPERTAAVGWFRSTFAAPAIAAGGAVLALGHPPKARDRQSERHGYGSTAWLDEVDGAAYQLRPGRNPIRRGASGSALLHLVKDRYGSVQMHCAAPDDHGWSYTGALVVDDAPGPAEMDATGTARASTRVRVAAPDPDKGDRDRGGDDIDVLAEGIVRVLREHPDGPRFGSERGLRVMLAAARPKVTCRKDGPDLAAALERLERRGLLERGEPGARGALPGWLTDPSQDPK